MERLTILPDQSGYSTIRAGGVLRSSLSGAAGMYRKNLLVNSRFVSVQWTIDPDEYKELCSFYKRKSKSASVFIVELITNESTPKDHYAIFVDKTFKLSMQRGEMYKVNATLEAMQT